jgi:hypothetical protein
MSASDRRLLLGQLQETGPVAVLGLDAEAGGGAGLVAGFTEEGLGAVLGAVLGGLMMTAGDGDAGGLSASDGGGGSVMMGSEGGGGGGAATGPL